MAQYNIQMPLFARAGNAPLFEWNGVDEFDVDALTEYLLEDAITYGGVTFDFSPEHSSGLQMTVSPENSVDGNFPPIAETRSAYLVSDAGVPQPTGSSMPLAPPGRLVGNQDSLRFPNLPAAVPDLAEIQSTQVLSVQYPPHGEPISKRPRVEVVSVPMVSVSSQNGSVVLSGEQLAAAATQAMQQGRGRKKNPAQVDRRRERNRILARRTRLRKKFFFESLQKEIMDLQSENQMLKDLVKTNVAEEHSKPILEQCDAMEKLPPAVLEACGELGELDSKDFNLVRSIQTAQHCFLITDPSLQDNPIVFASDDFLKLTGYSREQVLGRNCRFLQGPETDKSKLETIRQALAAGEDVGVTMINYTADGTPFWNKLFIAALRDAQNSIVNFIGVLVKVAAPAPGDPEHDKALPSVKASNNQGHDHAAESTVKAIEGVVTAAVAAAGGSM